MNPIEELKERKEDTLLDLIKLWEKTVRATHDFLTDADIEGIKPEGLKSLKQIEHLYIIKDEKEQISGFMGVEGDKIEMLFVDFNLRGSGIGKRFINFAKDRLGVQFVDVNEQNIQGIGFYQHLGTEIVSRSERDEHGRPFPILHLRFK